eukprot:3058555-Amphidinium_carterae.1
MSWYRLSLFCAVSCGFAPQFGKKRPVDERLAHLGGSYLRSLTNYQVRHCLRQRLGIRAVDKHSLCIRCHAECTQHCNAHLNPRGQHAAHCDHSTIIQCRQRSALQVCLLSVPPPSK